MLQKKSYNTLTGQTFHYLARPHSHIRREPIVARSAWKGNELKDSQDWLYQLSPPEIVEIKQAVRAAKSRGVKTQLLAKEDFPLTALGPKISQWQIELRDGRGFQVIRGVPVSEWDDNEAEIFFWCLGLHLGIPGTQNPQGDLLGHVRDTRSKEDQDSGRFYKTSKNINYHCDAADVVGLLCVKKAKEGGHSRIVSSVTVYNELLNRYPHLVDRLYQPFHLDTHGEGGVKTLPIAPCRFFNGKLKTFYHSDYFRSAFNFPHVGEMSDDVKTLLDTYEQIAEDPNNYIDMDLEPGDIQLVSNHTVLHARTAYTDYEDPEERRHLLRLWLSLPAEQPMKESFYTTKAQLELLKNVVPAKVKGAVAQLF